MFKKAEKAWSMLSRDMEDFFFLIKNLKIKNMREINNTLDGINIRLNTIKELNELEDIGRENMQNETERKK